MQTHNFLDTITENDYPEFDNDSDDNLFNYSDLESEDSFIPDDSDSDDSIHTEEEEEFDDIADEEFYYQNKCNCKDSKKCEFGEFGFTKAIAINRGFKKLKFNSKKQIMIGLLFSGWRGTGSPSKTARDSRVLNNNNYSYYIKNRNVCQKESFK
jgi:hypothetical protein